MCFLYIVIDEIELCIVHITCSCSILTFSTSVLDQWKVNKTITITITKLSVVRLATATTLAPHVFYDVAQC